MLLITLDMHVMEGKAMKMSRLVMVVAAACFATGSLIEAQGRGHGPAGHGPQIARAGSGGPTVGVSNSGGGKSGNAGVTPGQSGKGRSKQGTTPGHAGDRGKNTGGGSRGNAGDDRGNAGKSPVENAGGRGDGSAGGGGDADDDQEPRSGGRGRGRSDRHGASFVARMNPQQRARLESMLPSGMTLEEAADGFRNKGQFIAALQQSRNHDISFGDLKAQMTGDNPMSLGEAMRKFRVATEEDETPSRVPNQPTDEARRE
jgi:hypothetical protein